MSSITASARSATGAAAGSVTVPRASTPPCLRVHAYPFPLAQTLSIPARSSSASSIRTSPARTDTAPWPNATPARPSAVRSYRRPARRSQTAQNDWRARPIRTLATHSISSGPNTPT